MHCYPNDTLLRFQFEEVLALLEERCRSRAGKAMARQLAPVSDREVIGRWLHQTAEYLETTQEGRYYPPFMAPDTDEEINLLEVEGSVLEAAQFTNLREAMDTANTLIRFLKQKHEFLEALPLLVTEMEVNKEVVPLIDKVIEAPGMVKTSASRALADIRRDLSGKRQQANRIFQSELRKYKQANMLRDFGESTWNNRRVLAVLAEHKRQIKGILHGSSDTGRTAFIEPAALVGLNNDIIELEQDERREIHRILKELTGQLRGYLPELTGVAFLLAEMDLIRAKTKLAEAVDGRLPSIALDPVLELIDARHPLLFLHNKADQKPTIPLQVKLDQGQRILIISGPNAGGKSIALKTIGILQLMFQSGLLIPAHENTVMGVFERMFVDIGDDQSIEMELSTYSSRLVKMKYFLEFADEGTFFCIDEFGTGSDPELGGAIAEAILSALGEKKAFGVVTTHYSNIKLLGDATPGMVNACMLFDEASLQPLYKLVVGQPGSSYTFEVARKIGLRPELLAEAESNLDARKVELDGLLVRLQQEQQELEGKQAILQRELDVTEEKAEMYSSLHQQLLSRAEDDKEQRDKRNVLMEAGRRYQALIQQYDQQRDRKQVVKKFMIAISQEVQKREKDRKVAKDEVSKREQNRKQREKAKKQAEARQLKAELAKEKIEVGSKVRLKEGKQKGIVEVIEGNRATVLFGMMKTITNVKDLRLVEKKKKAKTKS